MPDTVFTPHHLTTVLTHAELAIFASDLYLFDADSKEEASAFYTLLNSGVQPSHAWMQVTGKSMLPSVASHLAVRQRMRTDLSSKKAVARLLGRWVKNGRVMSEKPYTTLQRLCERMQGFACMVPPEEVAQLQARAATWDTLTAVLDAFQRDWALAVSLTVLLHVVGALRGSTQLAFVGGITSVPTAWAAPPHLSAVLTDVGLPLDDTGNEYYVFVKDGSASYAVVRVSAHVGQLAEFSVPPFPPQELPPWWVACCSSTSTLVVGNEQHVATVTNGESVVHPLLAGPRRGTMTKQHGMIVWSEKRDLCGLDLTTLQPVADHKRLQHAVLQSARTAACACVDRNVVFRGGVSLFRLPEGHTIAAVSSTKQYVDVFTAVGDWWRVNVKTLEAVVVGLDLSPGAQIVDVCLLDADVN
jgi:hypothetical protein